MNPNCCHFIPQFLLVKAASWFEESIPLVVCWSEIVSLLAIVAVRKAIQLVFCAFELKNPPAPTDSLMKWMNDPPFLTVPKLQMVRQAWPCHGSQTTYSAFVKSKPRCATECFWQRVAETHPHADWNLKPRPAKHHSFWRMIIQAYPNILSHAYGGLKHHPDKGWSLIPTQD